MTEYTKTKYKYFFLAFSLSFFVLSLMFLFLMSMVHPKTPESLTAEPEADAEATAFIPGKEDALTVLFMGTATEDAPAGTFILARFDPAGGKVPITVFPPQTAVINNGVAESISEVFRYGGAAYTRDALAKTLGIPIDRYVRIRLDAFITGAAAIGSVEFDLPENITLSRGGAPITLAAGKQLLDGQKVSEIIRFEDYDGGELRRCEITANLAAAIVNQRMDICLSTVVDSVFEKLINLIGTDITYNDYNDRKPAAEFLAQLQQSPAEVIPVAGEFDEDNIIFTLSDTYLARLTLEMQ